MSDATDLAQVQAAIAAAEAGQKVTHGTDSVERGDLAKLYERERELRGRVNRRNRGPRVSGIRLRHS